MKIEEFLDYLSSERMYSKHSIIAYSIDLKQFNNYLNSQYEIYDLRDISSEIIRSWLLDLNQKNISPRSINRKIACLRSYFLYLVKIGDIDKNPMIKISSFKTPNRNPVFIQKEDILKILETKNDENFYSKMGLLIFEILYATGIRRSELASLEEKDVDFEKGQLLVFGKRRKERLIPLHNDLLNKIRDYIPEKKLLNNTTKKLFISKRGGDIEVGEIYLIIKNLLFSAQVEIRSPHVLRHSFATHLLDEGADIMNIKELLGHSSLNSTQVYTHNTIEKLKKAYKLSHPRSE